MDRWPLCCLHFHFNRPHIIYETHAFHQYIQHVSCCRFWLALPVQQLWLYAYGDTLDKQQDHREWTYITIYSFSVKVKSPFFIWLQNPMNILESCCLLVVYMHTTQTSCWQSLYPAVHSPSQHDIHVQLSSETRMYVITI